MRCVANKLVLLLMLKAQPYKAFIKLVGLPAVTVQVKPLVCFAALVAVQANVSVAFIYCPLRSVRIVFIASGEVKSMSCWEINIDPATVLFVTEFALSVIF